MRLVVVVPSLSLSLLTAAGCSILFPSAGASSDDRARARFAKLDVDDQPPRSPTSAARRTPASAEARAGASKPPAVAAAPKRAIATTAQLWELLGRYRHSFLKSWRGALEGPCPSASQVLDVFQELAYAVTGPGGFWRRRVPKQWLGCPTAPHRPACRALRRVEPELVDWDRFQEQAARVRTAEAGRFLARHQARLTAYLHRFAPVRPSIAGMEATGLYRDVLAGPLAARARSSR